MLERDAVRATHGVRHGFLAFQFVYFFGQLIFVQSPHGRCMLFSSWPAWRISKLALELRQVRRQFRCDTTRCCQGLATEWERRQRKHLGSV